MILSDLAALLGPRVLGSAGDQTVAITGAAHDSRDVEPGDVFIALKGARFDGHDYLDAARAAGATAALVEGPGSLARVPDGMGALAVSSGRAVLAEVALAVYRRPARELDFIGVTGTNGKTSTCYFLDSIARAAGRPSGLFTTLEIRTPDGTSVTASRTTPEATTLQKWLRRMADLGARQVAAEVSSHALDLGRVEGTEFAGVVYTNLSQDHLDWHRTMRDYYLTKAGLFTRDVFVRGDCVGAVNIEDEYGRELVGVAECPVVKFGLNDGADVWASDIDLGDSSTTFVLHAPAGERRVALCLLGRFAAWNALAAAALSLGRGTPLDAVVDGLEALPCVPGRLELVSSGSGPRVLVDYAHTPASLTSVLSSVRELCAGRLVCVFGCGGDRDTTKRPLMGRAVAEGADIVYVTSDNPRSEDPDSIMDMIVPGLQGADYVRIADRRDAIHAAVAAARDSDVVVVAGKGHETYQEFAGRTIHFDDREVAREALAARRVPA